MKPQRLFFDDWLKEQLKNTRLKKAYEEEDVRARLALRIAELRQQKKISQAQLAKKLHTTQQVISDIETFKHPNITLLTLQRIANALDAHLFVSMR
ncbi:MAG: helix-turn-helix transcriptional regulator [Elusimicrobia bacterium]|nr:helix-turn-helix transcriptional regulator [Elusimicrobiota bacterium]